MGVSFRELRETCQRPVRDSNDVAGLLFGDHLSLPLTKLFVDLRLSPSIASLAFFVCGLCGALLQGAGPGWAVAGAVLLLLYYLLDCVDGEVARWQGVEDLRWGYFDYIFHMVVKPAVFVAVGVGCWRELDAGWPLLAGAVAAVAVLWLKLFLEIPGILFLRGVLAGSPGGSRAFRRFAGSLAGRGGAAGSGGTAQAPQVMRLGFDLVTLRALLTNFDVGLVFLLVACLVDRALGSFAVTDELTLTARSIWLGFYAVTLPLNFLDYGVTYLRRGHFARETERLLALAHRYRYEPAGDPREPAGPDEEPPRR